MKEEMIPSYCISCYNGPCAFKVYVVDGTAIRLEPNPVWAEHHPGKGKFCLKSFGLIQKMYNPHRIKSPMKRTNPKKGRGLDPGWIEISWKEALDTIAEKLLEVRKKGIIDEQGLARLAMTWGEDGATFQLWGTTWAFLEAWGKVDKTFLSATGVKCYHAQHQYGELWHRSFACNVDLRYCKYLISNMNQFATTATGPIQKAAEAQLAGMKRLQIDPYLSVTAAKSSEWIPLRPKSDAAFFISMVHVILHELDWHVVCDIPFLKQMTNSPYLVSPGGYFARDSETKKPLIWDPMDGREKTFDSKDIKDFALEGEFEIKAIEIGPDNEVTEIYAGKPSFHLLIAYVKGFTPEWAAKICDIPVETIRRVAHEWVENAQVGSTITVRGEQYPLRPVATLMGKNATNGWGGLEEEWSRHILEILVGALEVPGADRSVGGILWGAPQRSVDGFYEYPFHPTDPENFIWPPSDRCGSTTLFPLTGFAPMDSPVMAGHHLSWKFVTDPPEHWPATSVPEVIFTYKSNPVLNHHDPETVRRAMTKIPFHVRFSLDIDETAEFADILLPEGMEFESTQLLLAGAGLGGQYSDMTGFLARFPVAELRLNTMDLSDIWTELASLIGILDEYNEMINKGCAVFPGFPIMNPQYALEPKTKYTVYEIYDRIVKGATDGQVGMDLLKEIGVAWGAPYPIHEGLVSHPGPGGWLRPWFTHNLAVKKQIRYQLPYQEKLMKAGVELKRRLHERNIHWWDRQCNAYQPLPGWSDHIYEVYGADPQFDLWLTNSKNNQYSWSGLTETAWCNQVAAQLKGHRGVLIHTTAATKRGIKQGDKVWVESPYGRIMTKAEIVEGIRPDTLLIVGQHGHYLKPGSRDLEVPSSNPLVPISIEMTSEDGGVSDHVKVKIYKA